jgi:hypothetical protein
VKERKRDKILRNKYLNKGGIKERVINGDIKSE